MAPQLKFKKSSPLLSRILSAFFLICLCLYCIYLGRPYTLIMGGMGALGITIEWGSLVRKCRLSLFPKIFYALGGTLYLSVAGMWFLNKLALSGESSLVYWLFFWIWAIDISAFIGGRFFKGPKLIPSVSPNKTWAGFITGMIVGVAVGYGSSIWLFPGVFTLRSMMALVLIAQLGDLLESQAKRWSHVKDSSALIPGHGGCLDRLDSLIAVSFTLALWEMI